MNKPFTVYIVQFPSEPYESDCVFGYFDNRKDAQDFINSMEGYAKEHLVIETIEVNFITDYAKQWIKEFSGRK